MILCLLFLQPESFCIRSPRAHMQASTLINFLQTKRLNNFLLQLISVHLLNRIKNYFLEIASTQALFLVHWSSMVQRSWDVRFKLIFLSWSKAFHWDRDLRPNLNSKLFFMGWLQAVVLIAVEKISIFFPRMSQKLERYLFLQGGIQCNLNFQGSTSALLRRPYLAKTQMERKTFRLVSI